MRAKGRRKGRTFSTAFRINNGVGVRLCIPRIMKGRLGLKSKTDSIALPTSAPALEQTNLALQLHGPPPLLTPAEVRRNYRLGVINGVLFALGDSLSSAGLVLALL